MDDLQQILEEAREYLEEQIGILAYGASVTEIGDSFEATSDLFQATAFCNLLLFFDRETYRKHLVFSGYARRYHLQRCQAENQMQGVSAAISRTEAFFNALVARHDALAADLAALSPDTWIAEGEYEDDFAYYAFIQQIAGVPQQADRARLAALLDQFEKALEGASSPRLDVCRALFESEAIAFEQAFEALLLAHEAWIEKNEKRRAFDPVFRMRCRLFGEGVALLGIAEKLGFTVEAEYRYCPSTARLPEATSWPPDIFRDVESIAIAERQKRTARDQ